MSLGRKLAASGLLNTLGTGANNLAQFLVFVILARLLDPATIGLVAFALVFVEIGKVVVFGGLPEAVIQRKEWQHDVASCCFTANLLAAAVFVAVMAAVGPLLSAGFAPEAGPVLTALSAILVIDALRAVHESKLKREFGFRQLASRGVIATLLSGAVGVALAYLGFGVWALVGQRLIFAVVMTLLTWRAARWRPSLLLSVPILRSMSGFAFHIMPARLLSIAGMKLPDFVIGLFIGPAAVGFYRVGARALETVTQLTVNPVRDVALSAFSRLPDAAAIGAAYVRVTRIAAFVACPVYVGAAATADDLIRVVFGPQWAPSGAVMAAIALGIGALTFSFFLQTASTAAGRTGIVLATSIGSFVATAAASVIAAPFGLLAVAVANSARVYLSLPLWFVALRRSIGVDWRTATASVAPPLLAALAMGVAVVLLRRWLDPDVGAAVRLLVSAAAGALLYPALMLAFARPYLRKVRSEVRPLLPERLRRYLGGGA
jgi:O-antigen/teichoic acid export membrane protein